MKEVSERFVRRASSSIEMSLKILSKMSCSKDSRAESTFDSNLFLMQQSWRVTIRYTNSVILILSAVVSRENISSLIYWLSVAKKFRTAFQVGTIT